MLCFMSCFHSFAHLIWVAFVIVQKVTCDCLLEIRMTLALLLIDSRVRAIAKSAFGHLALHVKRSQGSLLKQVPLKIILQEEKVPHVIFALNRV